MKNILVPIDFSTASHNASEYAVSLAGIFDANLIFIHAYMPPVVIDEVFATSLLVSHAELVKGNEVSMAQEIKTLYKKQAIKIEGLVREGFAPDIIKEMAKEKNADLIVMGMKGKGKSNSVFGSATTTIIRKTSVPVLVIPENAVYKSMDIITFAADFDAETEMNRYALLKELAEKYNSFIQILNVQKKELTMGSDDVIGKMRTDLALSKLKHSFHTIEDNQIEKGIHKFIEKNPSDILVMVAHEHTIFERMFGKVHTKNMSHQTKIPLLVL